MVYIWVGLPCLITFAIYIRHILYGKYPMAIAGLANLTPEPDVPELITLHSDKTVTFGNGTDSKANL